MLNTIWSDPQLETKRFTIRLHDSTWAKDWGRPIWPIVRETGLSERGSPWTGYTRFYVRPLTRSFSSSSSFSVFFLHLFAPQSSNHPLNILLNLNTSHQTPCRRPHFLHPDSPLHYFSNINIPQFQKYIFSKHSPKY